MSGKGLGTVQRVTLARIERLGDKATHETVYQAGLLSRRGLGDVIQRLHMRELIEGNGSGDDPYRLTPTGKQAKDSLP